MKKILNVEYDEVFIIDALPVHEYERFQISQELMNFLAKNGIKQRTAKVPNHKAIMEVLQYLVGYAASGAKFCIHFVCHGNNNGLGLKATREMVYWHELQDYLCRINSNMEGQLVVNTTSCFGLHGVKIVDEKSAILPFFGLIGYSQKIKIWKGKLINKLFYAKLLKGKPINVSVEEIKAELSDDHLFCISAAGFHAIKNAAA